MTHLFLSNKLWLCGAQKNKSWQNNVGPTLNQLTPKLHPKEPTPMRYLAEILLDATARAGSHKNSSPD